MKVKLIETSTYCSTFEACENTINLQIELLKNRGYKIRSVNSSPCQDRHLILTTIVYEIEDKKEKI